MMRFKFVFAWYDFWIGIFWDAKQRYLYFFPVPMLGIRVNCNKKVKMWCMACFHIGLGLKEKHQCPKCKNYTFITNRTVGRATTG